VSIVRIDAQLIEDLQTSIERTRQFLKENDKIRHIEEDVRFHNRIANACENMELCRVLETVQNQIWLFRCQSYDLSSSSAPEAHTTILEALEKRDHTTAVNAMRAHIDNVRRRLLDFMSNETADVVDK
jgi:DNA-binding GntR family transcriptional regulator